MTVNEALDKYLAKYRRSGRRGLVEVERRTEKHLRPFFGTRPAGLTTPELEEYANARGAEGVKDVTIRAELAALRRALKLAYIPIPPLPELEPGLKRRGYLTIPEFCRARRALPAPLQPPFTFAYMTGWRLRSEVLVIRKAWVNLEAGLVAIPTSKNRDPRRFPIDLTIPELGSLRALIVDSFGKPPEWAPLLFHRFGGKPIKDIRGSWRIACEAAGIEGRRPHDFRRSAVTNLHRAGVPMKTAMALVGHRTIQTHMDYIQEDDSDLRGAMATLERFYSKAG